MANKKHEIVRNYYDKVAIGYLHARWFKTVENIFDHAVTKKALEMELRSRGRVDEILEIGCGPGVWTDLFASFCRSATAIDVSQKMINEARKNTKKKNVRFICGDFVKHDFSQQFDTIASVRCIEYVQNKRIFVEKCRELLKPYGELMIVTKNPRSIWAIRQLYSSFIRRAFKPIGCGTIERAISFARIDTGTISLGKLRFILSGANFSNIRTKLLVFRLPLVPLRAFMFDSFAKLNAILSNSSLFLPFSESYLISGIKMPDQGSER